jgi:hypothetical protein
MPKMSLVSIGIIQGIMQTPALLSEERTVHDQGRDGGKIPQFQQVN